MLLVAVDPGGRLRCELANASWLARVGRGPAGGDGAAPGADLDPEQPPELTDVLPEGRRELFLDALGECAATGVPVRAQGLSFVPQLRAGRVVQVLCRWGEAAAPDGDRPAAGTGGPALPPPAGLPALPPPAGLPARGVPGQGWATNAAPAPSGRHAGPLSPVEEDMQHGRYRDVFDNALDQMALLELCADGRFRILEVNRSMERAMARPRAEIVGAFQDQLFGPEVDHLLAEAYRASIRAGGPVESQLLLELPRGRRRFESTIVPVHDPAGGIPRVVSIARDITEREQAEHTLRRVNRALQTLSSGNTTLVRAVDEPSLLSGMCGVMVRVGGYRRAWIGYPGSAVEMPVIPMAWASSRREEATRVQPDPLWLGPVQLLSEAQSGGQPNLSRPGLGDPSWAGLPEDARPPDVAASLILPLAHDGEAIGVLVVHSEDADAFEADELALLTELAADLSYGIHNLRTRAEQGRHEEQLLKAMNATIQALADTTELRDPYTAGHQRRVAELAAAVGRALGLSEDRVAGLYLASTIHDIGKISVPAELLSRPVPLSVVEYELMKQHVIAAYELLRGIEFPWPVADIVAQHHERCDGSGYPNGLQADGLLLESRILAVCDVVEAMSSHRPYRPGLGMEAALAEVLDGRGTRYDAAVVDACVGLLRSRRFVFS